MRRHPERVRTAVLNGVAPVHASAYVWGSLSLQRAFDRLEQQCRDNSSCSSTFPDFGSEFDALIERLRDAPQSVYSPAAQATVEFDLGDFAYAVRGMLYGPLAYELPFRVHHTFNTGDFGGFADFYLQRSQWVAGPFSTGMHLSTICGEDFPACRPGSGGRSRQRNVYGTVVCLIDTRMPVRHGTYQTSPESYLEPVRSDIPTLILSGTLDPVTPLEWGEEVARQLTNARHLVVNGGGHGVGGPCVDRFCNSTD